MGCFARVKCLTNVGSAKQSNVDDRDGVHQELKRRWPIRLENEEPTEETMALTLRALDDYPESEKLWIIRGNLLQLVDFDDGLELSESEKCYRRAISINPRSSEAYLELAHFLDAVMDKPRKAKQYFEKARLLNKA